MRARDDVLFGGNRTDNHRAIEQLAHDEIDELRGWLDHIRVPRQEVSDRFYAQGE